MNKDINQIVQSNGITMANDEKNIANVISSLISCFTKKSLALDSLSKKKAKKIIEESNHGAKIFLQSFEKAEVLKTLLATQMYEIHEQQQRMAKQAGLTNYPEHRQTYINNLVKLSNVFIQQTILMQKLTGNGLQKVIVEHVNVHNGGQAIVGNIESPRGMANLEEKEK